MDSTWRKNTQWICKMTEDKNEDNVTLKKSGKEETMTLIKAAAPSTRSAMSAATGNIFKQQQQQQHSDQEHCDCGRRWIKKHVTDSQQRWKNLWLLRCDFLSSSLRMLLLLLISLIGLHLLTSCFFSYSCDVAPNPRILWFNLRIQHSNSLWDHVFVGFLVLWVHLKTRSITLCP